MTTTPPSLDQLTEHAREMPSLPEVVAYMISALRDDNSNMKTLMHRINSDSAIVGRLLAAANSVAMGMSRHIHSIEQVFMVLGTQRVAATIIATSLIHRYDTSQNYNITQFWQHSLGTAVCARILAEQVGANTELCFVSGILHDIGRLLMSVASPESMVKVLDICQNGDSQLVVAEREVFGYDHCEAGRVLATTWNLPHDIIDAIAAHHEPDDFANEVCSITHIGDCLSHALDLGRVQNNRVPDLSEFSCAHIGLSWPMFAGRFGEIEARFDDFRLSVGL